MVATFERHAASIIRALIAAGIFGFVSRYQVAERIAFAARMHTGAFTTAFIGLSPWFVFPAALIVAFLAFYYLPRLIPALAGKAAVTTDDKRRPAELADAQYALKCSQEELEKTRRERDTAQLEEASLRVALSERDIQLNAARGIEALAPPDTAARPGLKPFRVFIRNLTVDGRSGNVQVVAHIEVTHYGEPAAIQKWQMLYWHEGRQREAGQQELQGPGHCLEELRLEQSPPWRQVWSYDDQIWMVTESKFADTEKREGFFWAELPNTPSGIPMADARTVQLQYKSDEETYRSTIAGACTSVGKITLI